MTTTLNTSCVDKYNDFFQSSCFIVEDKYTEGCLQIYLQTIPTESFRSIPFSADLLKSPQVIKATVSGNIQKAVGETKESIKHIAWCAILRAGKTFYLHDCSVKRGHSEYRLEPFLTKEKVTKTLEERKTELGALYFGLEAFLNNELQTVARN